jgi:hypothetical protein
MRSVPSYKFGFQVEEGVTKRNLFAPPVQAKPTEAAAEPSSD